MEADDYLSIPGREVAPDDLQLDAAHALASALYHDAISFASLVECRRLEDASDGEAVIFDVDLERGQIAVHDIRYRERIAAIFHPADTVPPEVLALRADFPVVPHLNLRFTAVPRSLCLYEGPYTEEQRHWTPSRFVNRVRHWLELTARGELHAIDQPLEPLLGGTQGVLVLPADLPDSLSATEPQPLTIVRVSEWGRVLLALRPENRPPSMTEDTHVAIAISGKPLAASVIDIVPTNVQVLHEYLTRADIDLIAVISATINQWATTSQQQDLLNKQLIIIAVLPKVRDAEVTVEAVDVYAFVCPVTLKEIGRDLLLWAIADSKTGGELDRTAPPEAIRRGHTVPVLGAPPSGRGADIGILTLNCVWSFSRHHAARLNGLESDTAEQFVLVGAGALGSQLLMNLVRSGYGSWTIIDDDDLLPHNLARHALSGFNVGQPKARALAALANEVIDGMDVATPIVANILTPGDKGAAIAAAIAASAAIIDVSASIAVARHLARESGATCRQASLFVTPSGQDAVLLVEDRDRQIPLDCLEMQYYRYLINSSALPPQHVVADRRIRYARSCRDVTSTLPQDMIAVHAAIGSRLLRRALADPNASIYVWNANNDSGAVSSEHVMPARVYSQQGAQWTLHWDERVIDQMATLRNMALPNETGGILIGAFDTQRNEVYIIDVLPSPGDSREQPDSYIRGCQDLIDKVEQIKNKTHYEAGYVGEWHSHPAELDPQPSADDLALFKWLTNEMGKDSLPPIMAIAGEHQNVRWFMEHIE